MLVSLPAPHRLFIANDHDSTITDGLSAELTIHQTCCCTRKTGKIEEGEMSLVAIPRSTSASALAFIPCSSNPLIARLLTR